MKWTGKIKDKHIQVNSQENVKQCKVLKFKIRVGLYDGSEQEAAFDVWSF